ncbi:hypothetical protein [Microbulbifer magnicolonia]|uniref:hypothetical protein n=1 Tax=Microbulbifer magnicolonia TaxID=3109744 RepID=UPI002B41394E|nr:hypothetical protein [Microbulbifer sp. GG15]
MKLSDREIEIISRIPKNRRNRTLGLWFVAAAMLFAMVVAFYIEYDLTIVVTMLGGFLAGQAAAHSSSRSEDKLIDLLQRYVSSDPEAIQQFAGARTGEYAA